MKFILLTDSERKEQAIAKLPPQYQRDTVVITHFWDKTLQRHPSSFFIIDNMSKHFNGYTGFKSCNFVGLNVGYLTSLMNQVKISWELKK